MPAYSHTVHSKSTMHAAKANTEPDHCSSLQNNHETCRISSIDRFALGEPYTLIPSRLYFAVHANDNYTLQEIQRSPKLFYCSTSLHECYEPFCADFGPVDIGIVVRFIEFLHAKMTDNRLKDRPVVYYCGSDFASVSNAAFLLAAYLMLEHDFSVEQAAHTFTRIVDIPIVPFRDPTYAPATFPITIEDCLRGLRKATELGWFAWRGFDVEEYEAMSDPGSGGDMSRICDKFVALRGPEEAPSAEEEVAAHTPRAYAHKLQRCGVTHIVRLNRPDTYHPAAFHPARFRHLDLPFPDCTTPPDPLVARFLSFCDAAHVVAVHCAAGLGRTGTMIGLWLMSRCGFTAREAITWLRLVRPGSVIGPQQQYLEDMHVRLLLGTFPHPGHSDQARAAQLDHAPDRHANGDDRPRAFPGGYSSSEDETADAAELSRQIRQAVTTRRFQSNKSRP